MPDLCCNPSCSESGPLRCGRCKGAQYCGPACQRTHWPAHKAACKAAAQHPGPQQPQSNCYILRATSPTSASDAAAPTTVADRIEPFPLSDLGNEGAEKRQLERRLGWKKSIEVGKFYDHVGTDTWYYYVYGDARAFNAKAGLPANEAASLVCYQRHVYGDVGIVRSGPMGSEYAEEFSKADLARSVEFYRMNDKHKVFTMREKSRAIRNAGNAVWMEDP